MYYCAYIYRLLIIAFTWMKKLIICNRLTRVTASMLLVVSCTIKEAESFSVAYSYINMVSVFVSPFLGLLVDCLISRARSKGDANLVNDTNIYWIINLRFHILIVWTTLRYMILIIYIIPCIVAVGNYQITTFYCTYMYVTARSFRELRTKEVQSNILPLLITTIATIAMYVCLMFFHPVGVYISLAFMALARPCVVSVATAYLRIRWRNVE